MRWVALTLVLLAGCAPKPAPRLPIATPRPIAAVATPSPLVFKTLLVIKRTVRLPADGDFPGLDATLSDDDIEKVRSAYEDHAKSWVATTTSGAVQWETTVRISDIAQTEFEICARPNGRDGIRILPRNLKAEFARVERETFDSLFVYVETQDPKTGRGYACIGGGTLTVPALAPTRVSIVYGNRDEVRPGVFLHEWVHQGEKFYEMFDVPQPGCTEPWPVHCHDAYGYPSDPADPFDKNARWLADFFNGTIQDPARGPVGFGPRAWAHGTFLKPVLR